MSRLLKIQPRFYQETSSSRTGKKSFAEDSGLVYTEYVCNGSPMTADWTWKTRGSSLEHGRFRSAGPGCSSLANMAIRSVLLNTYSVTAECLETLPWRIGQMLWRRIISSELDSLHIWKAFACAFPVEMESSIKRRQHVILQPNMSLGDYTKPLVSPSFQWITFLTLFNVTVSRQDLINLGNLVNLGVLTIGTGVLTPEGGLEDGVVRAWGRAAVEADAFSLLRVLNLRHQKHVTPKVFQYLRDFPLLSLFNLGDCSLGPKDKQAAMVAGWRYKTGKMLNDFLPVLGKVDSTWDSVVHACFRAGGAYGIDTVTAEGVDAINSLPVLHFTIGASHATKSDAGINASGNYKLQCFERMAHWVPPRNASPKAAKRPGNANTGSEGRSRKKPMLRGSRTQNMGDLLTGFGT